MNWPTRALLGPMLWAVAFVTIYALHGAGCAWGWPLRAAPIGNLQSFALVTAWTVFVALGLVIALRHPKGGSTNAQIVYLGGWIGCVSVVLTLFPVLGLTTCG